MSEAEERDRIDRIAREWCGTPYHNNAQVKGAGADCATLLKAVFEESGLIEPFELGWYPSQFFLHHSEERYLGWVQKFAHEIPEERAKHGDVVLYHIGKCYAHGAIVIKPDWPAIVHAHYATRFVVQGRGTSVHLGLPIKGIKFFSLW